MACADRSGRGGAAAAAPAPSFRRLLKRAAGDVGRIMDLVAEAEQSVLDNRKLCEVYEVAMNAFGGDPLGTAATEYGELCVQRVQLLCVTDPHEARNFLQFMAHFGIRQEDARLRRAAAALRTPTAGAARVPDAPGAPGRGPAAAARVSVDGRRSITTPLRPRALSYSGALAPCPEEEEAAPGEPPCSSPEDPARHGEPAAPAAGASAPGRPGAGWLDRRSILSERSHTVADLSPIPEAEVHGESLDEQLVSLNLSSDSADSPGSGPFAAHPAGAREAPACAPAGGERRSPAEPGDALDPPVAGSRAPEAADAESDLSGGHLSNALGVNGPTGKVFSVNGCTYRRIQNIGRGGSSKVYQVQAPSGEMLALKRVSVDNRSEFDALANEVTMLQQLQDCPHVVHIVDAELLPEQGTIHIVMEQGEMDLGRMLQSEPCVSLGDIQAMWKQLLEAVQAIHERRVVHSDIKPANFLLVNDRLKLIDFGIAQRIRSETTHINRDTNMGTLSYMAPEAVQQGSLKIGRSADVWSLGIILYQMVYRQTPFAHLEPMQRLLALTDGSVDVEFPPSHCLEGHSEQMVASLLDVLQQCLQRDPKRRPSIPQLLEHGFLRASTVEVSRCAFDRAMGTVVQAFCQAARDAILDPNIRGPSAGCDADEDDLGMPDPEHWQALADDVWARLSHHGHVPLRGRASSEGAELPGMDAFRACLQRWCARGAKRQRIAAGQAGAAPAGACEPPVAAEPCGAQPRRAADAQAPRPRVAASVQQLRQAAPSAAAAAAAAAATASRRAPFRPAGSGAPGARAGGAPGSSAIQADMLQLQRDRLKKTATAVGGPSGAPGGGAAAAAKQPPPGEPQESLVLRRLKDRRAVVAGPVEHTEELTQITRWGLFGA